MDEDKTAEIDALKAQARDELAKIRHGLLGTKIKLRPEIENAILTDSVIEIERTPEQQLNDVLKARGVNHNDRRRIIAKARKGSKAPSIPPHTRRANEIARKHALARASKVAS